jgi:hypothetical protein
VSGAHSEGTNRWVFSLRAIANQIDRATLRTTLTYQLLSSLSLGVEYNPLANDVGPLANWVPIREAEHRPAFIFGTSSDRIGTPHGRSLYGTMSKNLEPYVRWSISPYVGAAYGTYEDRWRAVAGGTVDLTHGFSSQILFDGLHGHGLLNYAHKRHVFSLVFVRFKDPGLSYSLAF